MDEEEQQEEEEIKIEVRPLTNTNEEVCMDSSIWSNLPSDIFERVVAHMPVVCLSKLRTVCTKLNQTISSKNFLNAQADLPCREIWIALFETDSCSQFCAYDPNVNRWYRIPLTFLPWQVKGLASAGGLLCCRGEIDGFLCIVVCNPITKDWTVLPPMIKRRLVPFMAIQVLADQTEKGFKVIVAGDDVQPDGHTVKDLSCEVFDSRTDLWSLSGPIPPNTDLELGSATCNGNLYLLSYNPPGAFSFNLQEGVWTKLQAPMPRNLTMPVLVECSGRLFMVGRVVKRNPIGSVRVWELSENAMAWKEFIRMKDEVFKELYTDKGGELYFTAVGHGNFIYFSIYQSTQMLAVDIRSRLWFCLPRYPATGASQGKQFLCYPFTPNLYASVSRNESSDITTPLLAAHALSGATNSWDQT
ncbi:hypothetical protein SUGI_0258880 [Cryptomeria japonica]|nr:hypothetical protein SUGI_0258880 [Cryptomeria japonica]